MNEASFTSSFKKKLEEKEFYVKKLADRTTRGIPDCFIAKYRKGIYAEIKYVEFSAKEFPLYFSQWSKIITGKKMVQLITMQELNQHFLSRYIIIYKNKRTNEEKYAVIRPYEFFNRRTTREDVPIILFTFSELIEHLHQLLQI